MLHLGTTLTVVFVSIIIVVLGQQYKTNLDRQLYQSLRNLRRSLANITGEEKRINWLYRTNRKLGKIQPLIPASQPFFCDAKNGPGARSEIPPESVNRVRPGDIDIIAAMGDSLTAANGAISNGLIDLSNENRAIAFSIGGRADWRKYLTLPNILREFNPNLYGYSVDDSFSFERASKFNVADPMVQYEDMLYQAQVLLKRLTMDPKVNMTAHWKLLTIFVGNNDICSRLCEKPNPTDMINEHKNYVYSTLRYLRKHLPRTIINWVLVPNLTVLKTMKSLPLQCHLAQRVECRCIYSERITPKILNMYSNIIHEMHDAQVEIINLNEFHTDTFTVNVQPFASDLVLPKLTSEKTDLRYFASDCFHFSQLGQASVANALWNNMMQPDGKKLLGWPPVFERFECPTFENAFIVTRENSKWQTIVN